MAAREEEEDGKDMKAKDVMEEVKVVWRTWRREEAERDGGWKLWQEVIDKRYARIMPVCIIITLWQTPQVQRLPEQGTAKLSFCSASNFSMHQGFT